MQTHWVLGIEKKLWFVVGFFVVFRIIFLNDFVLVYTVE